jgi:murein L,D-transpeptidase YafK
VASDRIERQRAAEAGRLPLPATPDTGRLELRLAEQGLKAGSALFIRIFKAQSEFEIWMERDGSFVHFATYPICNWSGALGAKIREGDRQTPEGFYTITSRQLHRLGRWPRALNIGFPNAYDKAHNRYGSYILVHGGCSTVGCFAMTDPVIGEIYGLVVAALRGGQRHVPVHVYPFRMTEENLAEHRESEWTGFWLNLKEAYDSFERTHRPPRISVCQGRYFVADGGSEEAAQAPTPRTRESAREAARRISMAGRIHEECPKPLIETALGKPLLAGAHMSRLGGPLPSLAATPAAPR